MTKIPSHDWNGDECHGGPIGGHAPYCHAPGSHSMLYYCSTGGEELDAAGRSKAWHADHPDGRPYTPAKDARESGPVATLNQAELDVVYDALSMAAQVCTTTGARRRAEAFGLLFTTLSTRAGSPDAQPAESAT